MKPDKFQRAGNYAAWLSRQLRSVPNIRLTRSVGGNQDQECARRRRFTERHGTAVGGAPVHKGG